MNPSHCREGYENTVLDFIVKVVMGDLIWAGGNLALWPADILKSGGHNKNNDAFGTAITCMQDIVTAMNVFAAANPALPANFSLFSLFVRAGIDHKG
jgi:hypothetical protein